MWKLQTLRWRSASGEAGKCIALALRDLRHPGLWWRSALLCIGATGLWIWLYVHYGAFFLELSAQLALIAFMGLVSGGGVHYSTGAPSTLSNMGSLSGLPSFASGIASLAQFALLAVAIAALFYVVIFLFGIFITVGVSLRWVLLDRAKGAAALRYPNWRPLQLPAQRQWTARDRGNKLLRLLLALCIPVMALWVVLKLLLEASVRLMYVAVEHDVLDPGQRRALASQQGPVILMLALMLCVLMLIPVLNLAVPVLLCGSVCHLQRRGWLDVHATPPPTSAERRARWRFFAFHVLAVALGAVGVALAGKAGVTSPGPYVLCLMCLIVWPAPLALYEFFRGAWRHAATHLLSALICLVGSVLASPLYLGWAEAGTTGHRSAIHSLFD